MKIWPAVIIIIAAFLRFYRLPEMAPFDFDQEYAANFAYRVTADYPIQLIGQPLSVEGLFMGPLGFYVFTPFYFLTSLHPIGGSIGAVIIGLIIIYCYFLVGRALFGEVAGLISALIRAISFIEIGNDLSPAPLLISELLVLFLWLSFYKYWHNNVKFLPTLALILGLFTSMHPVQFPFYLVAAVLLLIRVPPLKIGLMSVGAWILPLTPLLIFEYLHNFLEIRRLVELFTTSGVDNSLKWSVAKMAQYNLTEISRLLGVDLMGREWLGVGVVLIVAILVIRKIGWWANSWHWIMLALTYGSFFIYYSLLPKGLTEYYFLGLTTLAILYLGGLLSMLKRKALLPVLMLVMVNISLFNGKVLWEKWTNPSLANLAHKETIVKEILTYQQSFSNKKFYVSYIAHPGVNFGFDYLFKFYGQIPQKDPGSLPIYTIVLPKSLSEGSIDRSAGNIGLILPE